MVTIPVSTDPIFTQVTTLSGQDFVFTFEWNTRESAWYFDLADQDGNPITVSRKVVVNAPLITRCVDPRRPKGLLWANDTSGSDTDPQQFDFGTRVHLIYIEPGEF
jgi:hypothetical protein